MIAGVAVEALEVTVGAFRLQKLDFAVPRGETLVILGPNGAGKSVILETIAGFHRPESGQISIDGRAVTALPPERRKVGFVVQNFGLFPHLSAMQNVAIARRGDRAASRQDGVYPSHGDPAALLAYFGIAHLAERMPGDLSPGEKQRVALARALAGAPDLFLFDEPFAALDALTHGRLRADLLLFLRELTIPAILVTHDHADATALADRIGVLREGAMIQIGPVAEVFGAPQSSFVARFVGIENVLAARVTEVAEDIVTVAVGEQTLRAAAPTRSVAVGSSLFLSIRAEDVTFCCSSLVRTPQPRTNRVEGRVTALRSIRPLIGVGIDCGFPLNAYLFEPQGRQMNLGLGQVVTVEIEAAAIHLMVE